MPVSQPRIAIATPMYGGMCTGSYMISMLKSFANLSRLGIRAGLLHMTNESLITRARNELTRLFLEQGQDYLMFVDADIGFEADAIPRLLAADKDIVCGLYPKKEIDWKRIESAAQTGKTGLQDYGTAFVLNLADRAQGLQGAENGLYEVHHGGTGFMLIKRQVFETLQPHVPTYRVSTIKCPTTGDYVRPLTHEYFATSIDENGCLLSEDYHFCELWRKHGGKIYADPSIRLDHTGTYVYSGDIMAAGENIK